MRRFICCPIFPEIMTNPKSQEIYDENYYRNHCGEIPYDRSEHWIKFFGGIAQKITADFQPQTVLDAGCAIGLLVESLRQKNVEAYGFDISEWAIKQMPAEYIGFVKRDSLLNSKAFDKKFDLVICIEVLEHLQPSEAEEAIKNLCSWGDMIIFTSSPDDYTEPTHFNVQQPGYWAEKFARNGFVRVLNYDAAYITPWAQVFRRETPILPSLVRQYEDNLWIKTKQTHSQQNSIVQLQQKLDAQNHSIENRETETAAGRMKLAEEPETFKSMKEAHINLQKDYADLEKDFTNLEDHHTALKEAYLDVKNTLSDLQQAHLALNSEHAQVIEHLHTANENFDKICRTKAWKAVNFWWKSKRKVVFWLPEKRSRLSALYNTSTDIWQNQGSAAFANRLFRFVKGERLHTNMPPSAYLPETITEKTQEILEQEDAYQQWIKNNEPDATALAWQKRRAAKLAYSPLISILTPIFNTDEIVFEKMVESVLAQTYGNWELCLVDGNSTAQHIRPMLEKYARLDKRIKVRFLNKNLGISGNSNEGLAMAKGEFVALLDHDDELAPNALYENIMLLNREPNADMIYSDEDKLDENETRCSPYFKPDWSPDLLRSYMYTCHLGVYRTKLVNDLNGFRADFDGSQDHDLALRLSEQTDRIHHIPKILYHWRMTSESTAFNPGAKDYAQAARINAVQEHCERLGLKGIAKPGPFNGAVRFRHTPDNEPFITIIIPTRDKHDILKQCIDSILSLSTYQNYEILIVDNSSCQQKTLDYFESVEDHHKIRIIEYAGIFNYSAINNYAATQARGEILLFLNNDTKVISTDWLEEMLQYAVRKDVGAVGARLLYPNETVQHAGVIVGIGGVAGHAHLGIPRNDYGYFGRAVLVQNLSAVTGACLMTKAEHFKKVGGFNDLDLTVAFNDIDYCLKLREAGLLILYTPFAELYHYESLSRGSDLTTEKIERFMSESHYMIKRWHHLIESDPYYNPNLSLDPSQGTFALSRVSRCNEVKEIRHTNEIKEFSKNNFANAVRI